MANFSCAYCGSEIEETAKFCRRCGRPSNHLEATTRTLEPPAAFEAPTRAVNSIPTAPSFLDARYQPPAPAPTTRSLEGGGQKRAIIVLASLVAVLLIVLAGVVAYTALRSTGGNPDPPFMEMPQATTPQPFPPPSVPHPPLPPLPPRGGPREATPISNSMIYPGAETIMSLGRGPEGSVLQLRTEDPPHKVIEWYVSKMNPTKHIAIPGGNAILHGDGITAVITGGGDGTQIVLKQTNKP